MLPARFSQTRPMDKRGRGTTPALATPLIIYEYIFEASCFAPTGQQRSSAHGWREGEVNRDLEILQSLESAAPSHPNHPSIHPLSFISFPPSISPSFLLLLIITPVQDNGPLE